MKRETIIMDEYGKVTVPSDTANLWMSEAELLELFGVIVPTLRTTVKAVYKSGVLQSCEVERCIKQPNGYGVDVYALPMVVALAFRIGTPNAEEYAMPCWRGCACEKKSNSYGHSYVVVLMNVSAY